MKEDIKNKKEKGEVTRRDFLTGAGAAVVGAAVGAGIAYPLASGGGGTETVATTDVVTNTKTVEVPTTITNTVPGGDTTLTQTATQTSTVTKTVEIPVPGEAAINTVSLTVNGELHTLMVKPEETLRDLLRLRLGLTSVKDMCLEFGACGSCTVIMDGRPILSCMMLACECEGAVIETAEGLLAEKHPLIDMYVKHAALQCGFCTPGFVVTAKALLDRNPNPTEADIKEALGGNICRCSSYPGHVPAVLAAAEMLGGG
jgi:aerobic-type carbon monoxide dehydrogenase small subunit (CoxS/CutS family)